MSQVGEATGEMKSSVVAAFEVMGETLANCQFLQLLLSLIHIFQDFDVVQYLYGIDRMNLNEELATAIMIEMCIRDSCHGHPL